MKDSYNEEEDCCNTITWAHNLKEYRSTIERILKYNVDDKIKNFISLLM